MKGYIYRITNKVNGKSYIGQTRNTVEFRWRQHINAKDNKYFHKAIKKYGVENFKLETLECCNVEDLDSREIYYIAKYNTFGENGYNLTKGGSAYSPTHRESGYLVLDNKYDEIKEMYLAGYSTYKIGELYNVDRHCVAKILNSLGIKTNNNTININNQEFQELVTDYKSGCSLKSLAKRYGCSSSALKQYLIRKGVDIKDKYSILKDEEAQNNMIHDYLYSELKLREITAKYHCDYNNFKKVLSLHGIEQKGKGKNCKLNDKESLEAIKFFNEGMSVQKIADYFKVDKGTIYFLFKRYHVNYLKK